MSRFFMLVATFGCMCLSNGVLNDEQRDPTRSRKGITTHDWYFDSHLTRQFKRGFLFTYFSYHSNIFIGRQHNLTRTRCVTFTTD